MKFLPTFLLYFLTTFLGIAQEQTKVETHFYAFDYVLGRDTVMVPTGSGTYAETPLSKANIVGPIHAAVTDGVLALYDKKPAADALGHREVLASAAYPAGVSSALVVLFPASKNDPFPYRALVLNHNAQDFPLGVYRMINISPHPIRGAIGKSIIESKPGSVANLKPEGEPGAIVAMKFEYYSENRWNLLTETRCAIRNDRRWLTCIYLDPSTGRMNIRSIPDRSSTTPAAHASQP
jgi:hypothetical protein